MDHIRYYYSVFQVNKAYSSILVKKGIVYLSIQKWTETFANDDDDNILFNADTQL
jgi:hypothetical protein